MGELTLITGGVRAGKSRLAVRLATATGLPVIYVATAEAGDAEMTARIGAHQASRPAGWRTVEAPRTPAEAVRADSASCVVVDCLTLWVSNLLYPSWPDPAPDAEALSRRGESVVEAARELVSALEARTGPAIVVTNEVGSGIIPADPRLRAYEDTLGAVNAVVGDAASAVWLCVAGQAVELRGWGGRPVGDEGSD